MPLQRIASLSVLIAVSLCTLAKPSFAQENEPLLERNLFSIGAGLSSNEISNPDEDENGHQFFAAYELTNINLMQGVRSSVEFGFMDFGFDEDDSGIWASYVIDSSISDGLGWLAQAGFDIGDDSGLMFGAGLKIMPNETIDLRIEYVARDEVDSLLLNVMFHL